MSRSKLIVSADDFGLTKSVTDGIIAAHSNGIVTSTSALVNVPSIKDASSKCRDVPNLDIGIHLNFTYGRPVVSLRDASTLVDSSGQFLSQRALFQRRRSVSLTELRRELSAQYDRFNEVFGRPPSHVTCHHFVHLWPAFFRLYADLGTKWDIPIRNPVVRFRVSEFPADDALVPGVKISSIRRLVTLDSRMLSMHRVKYPDRFIDQFTLVGSPTAEKLVRIISQVPPGLSELISHPGYSDQELSTSSSYSHERYLELQALMDPAVTRALDERGVILASFRSAFDK